MCYTFLFLVLISPLLDQTSEILELETNDGSFNSDHFSWVSTFSLKYMLKQFQQYKILSFAAAQNNTGFELS